MTEEITEATPTRPSHRPTRLQAARRRMRWLLSGILLLLMVLGGLAYGAFYPEPPVLTADEIDAIVAQAMASATPRPADSAHVYRVIFPSLVLIRTHARGSGNGNSGSGVGAGVVVNAAGDVLTALHVVSDADRIRVHFADGSEATAEIIAAELENDIAVLHPSTPPELIVPAVLGSSNGLRVGDQVFAVGNPFGLTGSLSAGVISGFDRSFLRPEGGGRLEGLIQFDAAVNPGNSGGPLLNRNGQVVGIVTALANPSEQGFFVGIGFAVPIGVAAGAANAPDY